MEENKKYKGGMIFVCMILFFLFVIFARVLNPSTDNLISIALVCGAFWFWIIAFDLAFTKTK